MDSRVQELTRHIAALRRYAAALAGDTPDADDLVQETLGRVLGHLRRNGDARSIENMRGYLMSALHNLHADACTRDPTRRRHVALDDVEHQLTTPPSQLVSIELGELADALERIPGIQRDVVRLVALEGFSYREAADALGIPVGTVMSRLHRGRATLRHALSEGNGRRLEAAIRHAG